MLGVLGLQILFIAYICSFPRPSVMEGTDRPEWLPATATDVFYRTRGGFGWFKAAQFTISDNDFRAYAAQKGWELQEETDYFTILQFRPKGRSLPDDDLKHIKQALVYEKRAPNGGGISVAYNLLNSRAFYFESHN